MKSATQPGATSAPLVLPTNTKLPFAKLIIRGELGQVVQQWFVLQNKCTIGSASSCAIRCELPGIAAYHALLVVGAKQTFIRALAPKLTRGGESVNELLLTETENEFEIAGHKFELLRNAKQTQRPSTSQPTSTRLKFTLARPFELSRPRSVEETEPTPKQQEAIQDLASTSELNARWIADLIQSAVQPLEHQILNMLEPLNAVKLELSKKKETKPPKRRRLPKISRQMLNSKTAIVAKAPNQNFSLPIVSKTTSPTPAESVAPQTAQTPVHSPAQEIERQLPVALEVLFAKQAASLDILSERLGDMNSQLSSLERIVAENISSTKDNLPAPTPSNQESIERLQATTDKLSELLLDLQSRQSEAEKSDGTWRNEIRQQIIELQSEMRRPIVLPTPAVQSQPIRLNVEVAKATSSVASTAEALAAIDLPVAAPIQKPIEVQLPPIAQAPIVQTPIVQTPIVQTPIVQTPVVQAPVVQAPIAQTPVVQTPVVQTPVVQTPVVQTPVVQAPIVHAPAVQTPVVQSPIDQTPVVQAPQVQEPAHWSQVEPEFAASPIPTRASAPNQSSTNAVPQAANSPLPSQQYHSEAEAIFNSQFGFGSELSFSEKLDGVSLPAHPEVENPTPWLHEELLDTVPPADINGPGVIERPVAQSHYAWNVEPVESSGLNDLPLSNTIESSKVEAAVEHLSESQIGSRLDDSSSLAFPSSIEEEVSPPSNIASDNVWETKASDPLQKTSFAQAHESIAAELAKPALSEQAAEELPFNPVQHQAVASESLHSWSVQHDSPTLAEHSDAASALESQHQAQPIEASSTSLPSWWTEDETSATSASGINAEHLGIPPFDSHSSTPEQPTVTDSSEDDSLPSYILEKFGIGASVNQQIPATIDTTEEEIDSAANYNVHLQASVAEPVHEEALSEHVNLEADEQLDADEAERLASLFQMFGIGGAAPASQSNTPEQVAETEKPERVKGNIAHTNYAPFTAATPALQQEVLPLEDLSSIDVDGSSTTYEHAIGAENEIDSELAKAAEERARAALALTPYEIPQPMDEEVDEPQLSDNVESQANDSNIQHSNDATADNDTAEEESIEDYMTRLLARMRGNEEAPVSTANSTAPGARKSTSKNESVETPRDSESTRSTTSSQSLQQPETRRSSLAATAPFDPEEYVPRAFAPEKSKNLAAMRELANTSARSAIQVSARRKYGTALAMKLIVASIGFGVGCTLIMINGLNLNIGLIATVASFLVALIWGYDAVSTLKPILNAGSEKEQAALAAAKEAAGEVE